MAYCTAMADPSLASAAASAADDRTPRVEVGEIRFVAEIAGALGLSLDALLTDAGLPPDLFAQADGETVPLGRYFRLLALLSDRAGDEAVAASERALQPGTAQVILAGVGENMSLAHAMGHIANAYNVVHAGDYNRVERRADRTVYAIDDRGFPFAIEAAGHTRHVFMESVMVFLHTILAELSTVPLGDVVIRVDTRRPSQAGGGAFLRPWRAPIRYGARVYAIHYDARVAQIPVRPARETAFAHAPVYQVIADRVGAMDDGEPRRGPFPDQVRALLRRAPRHQNEVSQRLGLSPASLRRRLAEAGTSFRAIKAEIQCEQARHLLRCGHGPADVAERLGFSDVRSFSRAFKAQTGATPAAFRADRCN